MFRTASSIAILACAVAACAGHPPSAHTGPGSASWGTIADTDAMVFTDPVDLTRVRLVWLREAIQDHARHTGEVPAALHQVIPERIAPRTRRDIVRDGWDRRVRYSRSQDDFEIRSAGRDGRFGTKDDMVATRTTFPDAG